MHTLKVSQNLALDLDANGDNIPGCGVPGPTLAVREGLPTQARRP